MCSHLFQASEHSAACSHSTQLKSPRMPKVLVLITLTCELDSFLPKGYHLPKNSPGKHI